MEEENVGLNNPSPNTLRPLFLGNIGSGLTRSSFVLILPFHSVYTCKQFISVQVLLFCGILVISDVQSRFTVLWHTGDCYVRSLFPRPENNRRFEQQIRAQQ